ncbi:MAG: ATP-binding cassette domain-containing protein [Lentisphaerae bacterium]|jgi:ABC-type sugar transport system ATPase subunit|nr:ATP-binding cassette domain-containing protein [Lentisphaerota bacterium]
MSEVVFSGVGKVYSRGETAAVEDFSLAVRDGEFLVLVGPSGCGKSTTLRMVAGLETPTSGSIRIGERDVTNLPPKDRDIAMVFQNYALYPHMTVRENMAFALKLRRFPKAEIERRVSAAAESLGLTPYLGRLPKALSGGQRQRVALGRAIVREPAVFLFDEPLSNLDAKMRVEMRAEIIRLHNRLGATMIYVTHDQTEAMTMGERIVVMNRGRIQQVAPPLEIYERPANPFVAGFIGTPPMNLFPPGTLSPHRTIGVRPEHMTLSELKAGDQGAIEATVDFIEPLGPETLVHVAVGPSRFHAVVREQGFSRHRPGDRLSLGYDASRSVDFGL